VTNAYQKVTVVVGVFQTASRLKSASESLQRNGITADDVVLLGSPGALDGNLNEAAGAFLSSSIHWMDVGVRECGDAAASILKRRAASFEEWMAPPLAGRLAAHLAGGACLLFVSISSIDQIGRISEILLRDSADSVQSHEFSPVS
jgi:hypothetical protein